MAFQEAQNQRDHMKGEWHRYNLKRRVAQLPPIDEESFNSKVASIKESPSNNTDPKASKREERRRKKEAIVEQKRQILETARRATNKRETDKILGGNDKEDTSSEQDEANLVEEVSDQIDDLTIEENEEKIMAEKIKNKVEIPKTTCLFCNPKQNSNFETLEENIHHMLKKHGLYIPEIKYLVDKDGLIEYLGEKIGLGNVCLCCSYQGKNIEAVRDHMNVKRHMKIPYETEDEKLEISEFYDFTSSYDDYVEAGETEDADNEGWEDVSEDEDDVDDESLASSHGAIIDGHELILPTGKVLGHRSMQRYYRQNLPPERELNEGQGTLIAAEDRHMLNVRDKKQYSVQKRAWSREMKRADINDRRSAKHINFQPHYRDQLLQ